MPPALCVTRSIDDRAVHVRPLRVVVHALRDDRSARHEAERLDEVREAELAVQLPVDDRPLRVCGEERIEGLAGDGRRAHVSEIPTCLMFVYSSTA